LGSGKKKNSYVEKSDGTKRKSPKNKRGEGILWEGGSKTKTTVGLVITRTMGKREGGG